MRHRYVGVAVDVLLVVPQEPDGLDPGAEAPLPELPPDEPAVLLVEPLVEPPVVPDVPVVPELEPEVEVEVELEVEVEEEELGLELELLLSVAPVPPFVTLDGLSLALVEDVLHEVD